MQLASRGRGNLFIYASTIFTILGVLTGCVKAHRIRIVNFTVKLYW